MSEGVSGRLQGRTTRYALVAVAAVLAVLAPFVLGSFQTALLAETLLFAVFATAFNLLYGYTGLLSFGHAMFPAVAGYTVAKTFRFLAPELGMGMFGGAEVLATLLLALFFATVVATFIAVFIGYLSVQLEEIYFAMITLSFSMAIYVIVNQDIGRQLGAAIGSDFLATLLRTNGSDGLTISFSLLGEVDLFGFTFQLLNISDYLSYYFLCLIFFVVAMYVLWRVVNSPFGVVCQAIRENPGRAEALGIDVTRHSWVTFIVSGAFSGMAGGILVLLQTGARPNIAYWTFSAEPVIMTVIGGPYFFLGPLAGAFTYEYLRWIIDQVGLNAHWQFAFGTLLLIVVLFAQGGVAGAIHSVYQRLTGGDGSQPQSEADAVDSDPDMTRSD